MVTRFREGENPLEAIARDHIENPGHHIPGIGGAVGADDGFVYFQGHNLPPIQIGEQFIPGREILGSSGPETAYLKAATELWAASKGRLKLDGKVRLLPDLSNLPEIAREAQTPYPSVQPRPVRRISG